MNWQQKTELVGALKTQLAQAKAAYLTKFIGLKVSALDELRSKVREAGGKYRVIKNTLALLGSEGTPYEDLAKNLSGPKGWAYTDGDPVNLAKALKQFLKDNEEFAIENGVLDGQSVDGKGIEALAELPSREVLLAQFLSVLNAPATNVVMVLQGVPRQLVNVIEQIRKKKEEEESKNG